MNDPCIEVRNVTKRYGRFALEDITLNVKQGYITGLVGANGAGKSSLIKLLMGMSLPLAGEVRLFGEPLAKNEAELKERIGYVADDSHFYEHLSIQAMKSIYAPFYRKWDDRLFRRYLDRFGLSPKALIRSLSKGMKMKLALAFALSHQAELLIMDEPTAGLDPVFRRELLDILAELMLDERHTILFSTHITTDLDRVADYIAFLHQGRLVFHESKEEIFDRYAVVRAENSLLDADVRRSFVGIRETPVGFEALTSDREEAERLFSGFARIERATLEDIMFFTAKGVTVHG
ncbi:ABC transporter ATP-binding protein [Cohnella thailandensis]|uniref:ABC transporter ATP-binding protein n=1 Tax=Cohnella thailandensis TaxID=557557 RepID=A0A841SWD0_9BACL|nr:ABC transporter ATP-binding protein [Cohnella thailandensis]MBB6633031.1 ABC transporter ATP-binding protein [Cohnella thailandensis]MBP1975274.1 ABC-2 type transport system ATP-binding protein [Cohnella thailandensis]